MFLQFKPFNKKKNEIANKNCVFKVSILFSQKSHREQEEIARTEKTDQRNGVDGKKDIENYNYKRKLRRKSKIKANK